MVFCLTEYTLWFDTANRFFAGIGWILYEINGRSGWLPNIFCMNMTMKMNMWYENR